MLIKAYQAIGFNLYACEMCSYLEKMLQITNVKKRNRTINLNL